MNCGCLIRAYMGSRNGVAKKSLRISEKMVVVLVSK